MEKSTKIAKIVLWVLFGISAILMVLLLTSIESQDNPGARAEKFISLSINWTEILVVVGLIIALFYAGKQIIADKKKAIGTLLILVAFALVVIISYAVSSSEIPTFFGVDKFVADGTLTPSISRWVGTGLMTTYILFAGAALSVLGFGVVRLFKR